MSKIVAIMGGGDWTDASVEFIEISNNVDLKALYKDYNNWVKDVYWKYKDTDKQVSYMPFINWLIKYTNIKEADIEEFWET